MTVKFNRSGTELFLEKLEILAQGNALSQQDINAIMGNRVVDIWIKAYESWIPDARADFERILANLQAESPENLSDWGTHIDNGIRSAIENLEKMQASLALLSEFNWPQAEWYALKFLPESTQINVEVFATVDGFNGGMFRPGKVFISLLYMSPSMLDASNFSHEFHHSGFDFWWKKTPFYVRYNEQKDTAEYWALRLFEYLISEGLANAFCSPTAIEKVDGDSEWILAHNEIIQEYEDRWDEFHSMLDELIRRIASGNIVNIKEEYDGFTMDMSGRGHPIGHFFSGRMIREMDRSRMVQREQIIKLVREPFSFFNLYNTAAKERGLKEFSKDLLQNLDSLIAKLADR